MTERPTKLIRIGLIAPPHCAGDALSRASQTARAHLADSTHVRETIEILTSRDDQHLGVVDQFRQLAALGCRVVLGPFGTAAARSSVAELAESTRTLYVNIAPDDGLLCKAPLFFGFAATPRQETDRLIPFLVVNIGPKLFFATARDEISKAWTREATRSLQDCGGALVGQADVSSEPSEIDALIARLGDSGAAAFLPHLDAGTLSPLLIALEKHGLNRHMAIAPSGLDDIVAASLPPQVRQGLYACGTGFRARGAFPRSADGAKQDESAAHAAPTEAAHPFDACSRNTYVAARAVLQALLQTNSGEPGQLVAALEASRQLGPYGEIWIDSSSHRVHLGAAVARCGLDAGFTVLEIFPALPPLGGHARTASSDSPQHTEIVPAGNPAEVDQDGLGVAVVGVDGAGRIEYVNRRLRRMWGLDDIAPLLGSSVADLWERPQYLNDIVAQVRLGRDWQGELSARCANGKLKRLLVVAEPTQRIDGSTLGYTLACMENRDPTLKQTIAAYQTLAMADVAVLAINQAGIVVEANRRASELLGYPTEELLGLSVNSLIPPNARARHAVLVRSFLDEAAEERPMGIRNEVNGVRKDGSRFPAEVAISKFRADGEWVMVASLRDITDRKTAEEELLWRASHDALTGLPNRNMVHERLTRALERSRHGGEGVALLFIDLDGFKLINDSHGHATGDALLKMIAHRLIANVRPGDTVGRLGGDEFVVLCERVDHARAIAHLAGRLNDALREPLDMLGLRLYATASIGLALGHGTTHNADELLRNADAAMYRAKERGRDGWQGFNEEIHEQARRRLDIVNGLRQAIERGELETRFQPILCAESGLIRGAELLLRWHPESGDVPPSVFVPIAEMTGAIVPIGKWVFRKACEAEVAWRERFVGEAPYVSVNVSARQLNEDALADTFQSILEDTGAEASRITLELTETSLMTDVASNLSVLRQLADLGLRIAVDDFGTGYSSLAQLLRMPVSALKIDREFVEGLDKRHDSQAIVTAVCSMARAMRLEVIAEGVENASQLEYLRTLGCDFVQGFHFYRPMTSEAFLERLIAHGLMNGVSAAEELYSVLYVSLATHPMSEAELQSLLATARETNRPQGITGFLLYLNGSFMQMIEGGRSRVERLMERIVKDPRHHSVRVVFEGKIKGRIFSDWSMGFRDMDHDESGRDFDRWRTRTLNFIDMSDDARTCYNFIAAFAHPIEPAVTHWKRKVAGG